jgi:3-oxoadipate enol-lactonase
LRQRRPGRRAWFGLCEKYSFSYNLVLLALLRPIAQDVRGSSRKETSVPTAAPEGISSIPLRRHGGAAAAVVFLHGIGGAARAWGPQIAAFTAAGLHPVALDLPGYGARPAVETMDFEALAADLETTIDRLGLERPALVGHSMGGMIAQTAMRRRPDGYRAAVLVGTSPAFGDARGEFQKKFIADRLGPLEVGATMRELAASIIDSIMGPDPDASGRALAIDTMAATPASTYRAAIRCIVTFDERANLPNIGVPVLCLAGQHDRNAPPVMMERMAAKIPGARYVCLSGAGHLPNLETPAAFNAAVLDLLLGTQSAVRA